MSTALNLRVVPLPVPEGYVQLFDAEGNPILDSEGNPIYVKAD